MAAWNRFDDEVFKMTLRCLDSSNSRGLKETLQQEAQSSYKKQALVYLGYYLAEEQEQQEWIEHERSMQDKLDLWQDKVCAYAKANAALVKFAQTVGGSSSFWEEYDKIDPELMEFKLFNQKGT